MIPRGISPCQDFSMTADVARKSLQPSISSQLKDCLKKRRKLW
jgi:hypothetical protein